MYQYYKDARDKAWEVLLACGIRSLPVDLGKIAEHYEMKVVTYSDTALTQLFREDVLQGDGFIIQNKSEKQIFINDKIHNRNRRRFTLAHEIGHGVLQHEMAAIHYRHSETDSQTDVQELQANIFARDILMPATVLAALDIHTPEEIMQLCHVSRQSAEIRAKRLEELYKRNMFDRHPLEREVRKQFDRFIKEKRKRE